MPIYAQRLPEYYFAMKDVAGMRRSFHYTAYGKILLNENDRGANPEILEQVATSCQPVCELG